MAWLLIKRSRAIKGILILERIFSTKEYNKAKCEVHFMYAGIKPQSCLASTLLCTYLLVKQIIYPLHVAKLCIYIRLFLSICSL